MTIKDTVGENTAQSKSSYSLSQLFVITATCAILAASAAVVSRSGAPSLLALVPVATAWIGALFGIQHYQRSLGLAVGLIVGAALGIALSALLTAPSSFTIRIVAAQLILSVLIVCIAAFKLWRATKGSES